MNITITIFFVQDISCNFCPMILLICRINLNNFIFFFLIRNFQPFRISNFMFLYVFKFMYGQKKLDLNWLVSNYNFIKSSNISIIVLTLAFSLQRRHVLFFVSLCFLFFSYIFSVFSRMHFEFHRDFITFIIATVVSRTFPCTFSFSDFCTCEKLLA